MTAIASPSSLQPMPGWHTGSGVEGLESMSAEEVSRMFMPRKSVQRQNSSSSVSSASTVVSKPPAPTPSLSMNGEDLGAKAEQGNPVPRKKAVRGLWPAKKADSVPGVATTRPQIVNPSSSGQVVSSTMSSAANQSNGVLNAHGRNQPTQSHSNGASRGEQVQISGDSSAVLALLPMTGTFERKQIMIPFFPETLRIGRQTNAKTIPTPVNGYFDSKVLSRQHAEVWADRNGKIWIRDVKSSNGTFVNGQRLSPENRDSEPHELREQDTLELGIDIVSEDQKSIVHHKVSAKVELAGMYSHTQPVTDIMNIDPATGQPYQGDPMSQQVPQLRGRGGSHGAQNNNGRQPSISGVTGGGLSLIGPQRQMNVWMGPITIEQVVRKLTTELKQAKQQTRDLSQTGEFFTTLMTMGSGQQSESPPPDALGDRHGSTEASASGIMLSPEILSPFSHPPAPPPQQPLPRKPDSVYSAVLESQLQPIARSDTERPNMDLNSSLDVASSDTHIVSLMDALRSLRAEKESQGDRIRSLELALRRERRAREMAERKARGLSPERVVPSQRMEAQENGTVDEDAFEPPPEDSDVSEDQSLDSQLDDGEAPEDPSTSLETRKNRVRTQAGSAGMDSSTMRLQARLDLMVQEMSEMKDAMESYKRQAEDAEKDKRSLAEMVKILRTSHDPQSARDRSGKTSGMANSSNAGDDSTSDSSSHQTEISKGLWSSSSQRQLLNGNAVAGHLPQGLEQSLTNVLRQQRPDEHGRIAQSAPYISMFGVVLIGVGLMTWLNGWQPGGGDR